MINIDTTVVFAKLILNNVKHTKGEKMGTIIGDGITFDDVLLVPQYSEVTPNMVDLSTHLTKKLN